ncbi:S8 family peptidase [Spongisporangium articulatum]|uniref:S8 family peptidase n=1 Tax=Spongisporangium articulatum TaxID=3362603 RepID=A0ABW8ASB3_9ACTN
MTRSEFFGVGVVDDGLSVEAALAATNALGRDVGALVTAEEPPTLLVEGELLVEVPDEAVYRNLQRRTDLVVGPVWTVPEPPAGVDPGRMRPTDDLPRLCTVRPAEPLSAENLSADAVVPHDGLVVDLVPAAARLLADAGTAVTSPGVVGTLALAESLRRSGLAVGVNTLHGPATVPQPTSQEGVDPATGAPFDPYTWPEINGLARIDRAWQLIEGYRQLGGVLAPVTLAVLDRDFWIGADGTMQAPPGLAPEFPNPVVSFRVGDTVLPFPVGGPGPAPAVSWHGQKVASVAAAPHDDRVGVAGAGGQVAVPWFGSIGVDSFSMATAVLWSTAWGADVINISRGGLVEGLLAKWSYAETVATAFEWARDQGVVMVVAAGNDDKRLPDYDVRPATRTPGVITVGALDGNVRWYGGPSVGSNFGESVDIWTQGKDVHVGPTPLAASVTTDTGTSLAAPLVSGVAALLRALRPGMTGAQVQQLLQDTGVKNLPDASTGIAMNAGAAVWELLAHRFPDDAGEGDDATGRPRRLVRDGGVEEPLYRPERGGPQAISVPGDADWYGFTLDTFAYLRTVCRYASGLGTARVELVPDDPDSRALDELSTIDVNHGVQVSVMTAPGTYRLKVVGQQTLYDLEVGLRPTTLQPDEFEGNDTQASAVGFLLGDDPAAGDPFGIFDVTRLGPGTHDLTLKSSGDADWIRVDNFVKAGGHREPMIIVSDTDAPVSVEFYDADGRRLKALQPGRQVLVTLPPGSTWVRFSTAQAAGTRFRLRVDLAVDVTKLPPHDDMIDVSLFGHWWEREGVHITHPPVDETEIQHGFTGADGAAEQFEVDES